MARFFDAKKHGDLQKQATTESDSFSQLKTQRYANVAPRFEKAAALHQSNQVLALTTAILLFKLGQAEQVAVGVGDQAADRPERVGAIGLECDQGRQSS